VIGNELGADMRGLLLHLLHEPGALDNVGIAGIILDVGGDRELPAGCDALDQNRIEHGARGIDRRRIAGRAGSDDHELSPDNLCVLGGGHRPDPDRLRQRRRSICLMPGRKMGVMELGAKASAMVPI
jgi:hypothetical protein